MFRIVILFVCTGNLCRSPMAEAIARHRLPDGVFASAGTWAARGDPATAEAIAAAAEVGGNLAQHRSQPVTARLLREALEVHVMTERQRREVVELLPDVADRVGLLGPAGGEIADPYGWPISEYRACRDLIVAAIEARVNGWRATLSR